MTRSIASWQEIAAGILLISWLLFPFRRFGGCILRWANSHPCFAAEVALLAAVLLGAFGEYGVPPLFWVESPLTGGLAVAVILLLFVCLSFALTNPNNGRKLFALLENCRRDRLPFGRRFNGKVLDQINPGLMQSSCAYRIIVTWVCTMVPLVVISTVFAAVFEVDDLHMKFPLVLSAVAGAAAVAISPYSVNGRRLEQDRPHQIAPAVPAKLRLFSPVTLRNLVKFIAIMVILIILRTWADISPSISGLLLAFVDLATVTAIVVLIPAVIFVLVFRNWLNPITSRLWCGNDPLRGVLAFWSPDSHWSLKVALVLIVPAVFYVVTVFPLLSTLVPLAGCAGIMLFRGKTGRSWTQTLPYSWKRLLLCSFSVAVIPALARNATAPLVICLFLTWIALLSAATHRWSLFRRGSLAAGFLALVALCNGDPYKLTLPNLEKCYETRAEVDQYSKSTDTGLLHDRDLLEKWKVTQKARLDLPAEKKPKLIVVSVSGGGISAAVWTGQNLKMLEDSIPGFPSQVRLITGASGGMLGASYYVGALEADAKGKVSSRPPVEITEAMSRDSLTPVVRQLVFGDLFSILVPWRQTLDRGRALEQAWIDNTGGSDASPLAKPFRDLAVKEAQGWCPSLVLSPVSFEDRSQLLISNVDLRYLNRTEFFKLFPRSSCEDAQRLKLCTAVRMNATFPYVSPPLAYQLPVPCTSLTLDTSITTASPSRPAG